MPSLRPTTFVLAATAAAAGACASPPITTAPLPGAPPSTATSADERMRFLLAAYSADSMRGREAGTAEERKAAEYIAARLAEIGLEPAGDPGGFLQRVAVVRRELRGGTRFTITSAAGTTTIEPGRALIPLVSLGEGAPLPQNNASGDLVFAGYGLSRPDLKREDFGNLPMQDRVVVVINGAPRGTPDSVRLPLEANDAMGPRLLRIVQSRPAAIIVLTTGKAAEDISLAIPDLLRGMTLAEDMPADESVRLLPMILLGVLPDSGSPLVPANWPSDDRAQVLTGRRFTGVVDERRTADTIHNVVGILRGRDNSLRNTYVAFGAHLDHIGVIPPVDGDSIANGADDDGSGVVALLEAARGLATQRSRPRRSMLFVFHSGEEKGLLGSSYFTRHPTVPIDSIVAQINADMVGRNGRDSVFIVGPSAAPNSQSAVLGQIADSVNVRSDRPLIFDRTFDNPAHPEHIYERSDHYSYAKRGIPVVFFTGPIHEDYHRVTDEVSKINFEGLGRVARLIQGIGEAVGNRSTRPR